MDQSVDMGNSLQNKRTTIIRILILSCTVLAMNVGNLFRVTYTSQLTAKTLPSLRSDLKSIGFTSIPMICTGAEAYDYSNRTKTFASYLTVEIKNRLNVAANNSHIYKILTKIKDRITLVLSSWYDFAFSASSNNLVKTINGYQALPEILVVIDDENACNALIKLFTFKDVYFTISYRSSGIYTEKNLYIADNTMLARILTPGFYGLEESGILQRWQDGYEKDVVLSPIAFYSNNTYFRTDFHRALVHWPPKKSPGFENDVVGLGNFILFGYIMAFLYF